MLLPIILILIVLAIVGGFAFSHLIWILVALLLIALLFSGAL